ncbi:MAG: MCE family protein [Planctomycetes bacterium]|nr:MCE family protein [Planctomycetota bacterium]
MASRKEKVNAGLFVLLGALLLCGSVAVVAGLTLERSGVRYLIKIPKSVGGLREGSVVKYLGVHVGRVQDVDFPSDDLESVRVMVEITRPSTPLRSTTYATLSSNFLTGETSIELQGGGNADPRLLPGAVLEWRPTTLMRLEDALPGVLEEMKRVVAHLDELLGPANQERVATLVDGARALVTETTVQLKPLAAETRALREGLVAAADRIAADTAGLRVDVTASVNNGVSDLQAAAKSIDRVAKRLDAIAAKLEVGEGGVPAAVAAIGDVAAELARLARSTDALVTDNRDGVRRTVTRLEAAVQALAHLLEQLDENPSHLLFSAPPPEHERGAAGGSRPAKGGS